MSDKIAFTRNYTDHSTNQGFQFEFHCDRCGTGYRTRFQASTLGTISNALLKRVRLKVKEDCRASRTRIASTVNSRPEEAWIGRIKNFLDSATQ